MIQLPDGSIWEWVGDSRWISGDPARRTVESCRAFFERVHQHAYGHAAATHRKSTSGRNLWRRETASRMFEAVAEAYVTNAWSEAFLMPWGHVYVVFDVSEDYSTSSVAIERFESRDEYLRAVTI